MMSAPAKPRDLRTIALVVWFGWTVLAAAIAAVRVYSAGRAHANLAFAVVLAGLCAPIALAAWRLLHARGILRLLGVGVGYHAVLGPLLLTEFAIHLTSRNDMLSFRLYPHVVEFINSFE